MIGQRKFTVALTALILGAALAFAGHLSPQYVELASICVGAFTAGNALEHKFGGPRAPSV